MSDGNSPAVIQFWKTCCPRKILYSGFAHVTTNTTQKMAMKRLREMS
jgi:hypothetical protein